MSERWCQGPECRRPARVDGGEYCETHAKQLQRTGKLAPIAEKLTPEQRLLEAALAWAEADPMDDAEYERARRAVLLAAKGLKDKSVGARISREMRKAKTAGKRIGRPPKIESDKIQRLFAQVRSTAEVARVLGISERHARRHRPPADKKTPFVRSSTSPRAGGSSR